MKKITGGEILSWYQKNKRDLPWRKTSDPYAIVVSEMMLQQTRVDTVIDYYNAFLQRFADVYALSAASEADVLGAWQGLGYYSRARNLHRLSKQVVQQFGGVFPKSHKEWLALPGVGPYIAGAVMSIAYNQSYAAVDGNVLRVIARLDGTTDDIMQTAVRKRVEARVLELMTKQHAGDFTQAMMELGALVCKPTLPECSQCPISCGCAAYTQGMTDAIPVKKKKKKPKVIRLWAIAVQTERGILLEYRANETLLAKMWGIPVLAKQRGKKPETIFYEKYGVHLEKGEKIGEVTHIFTHQRWEMDILRYRVSDRFGTAGELEWADWEHLGERPIPTAFQKVFRELCPQETGGDIQWTKKS